MERTAVVALVAKRASKGWDRTKVNPYILRPPAFSSTTFAADLMDIHPRSNGDVRVTLICAYEDRHAAFALTDAWGASLRVTVTRAEDYADAVATDAEESDRAARGDTGPGGDGPVVVDLSYQRNRAGARPHLD